MPKQLSEVEENCKFDPYILSYGAFNSFVATKLETDADLVKVGPLGAWS